MSAMIAHNIRLNSKNIHTHFKTVSQLFIFEATSCEQTILLYNVFASLLVIFLCKANDTSFKLAHTERRIMSLDK